MRGVCIAVTFFVIASASQAATPPAGAPIVSEPFSGTATAPYLWQGLGDACLTAGTTATPGTSLPACNASAPPDAAGSGAALLTTSQPGQSGAIFYTTPLATAQGIQVIFTGYQFGGTSPGANGIALFFCNASQAFPTALTGSLSSLGYALPSAYLGVGFDTDGNFSSSTSGAGKSGASKAVAQTIALRGAAATGYQYLGIYKNSSGVAVALPFPLDAPASATRPANAPTYRVTLTPAGLLVADADSHNGKGFVTYYSASIKVNAQPSLPAQVYVGFSATTSSSNQELHEIGNVSITTLAPATTAFLPTSISGLAAWYDASDPTTIAQTSGAVSSWLDKSGNGNTVTQTATAAMPTTGDVIDGLSVLGFAGAQYLTSNNAAFSSALFNHSTVFAVTNQFNATQSSSVLSAGYLGTTSPLYDLRLSDGGVSHFDFNNSKGGRLTATGVPTGPALWTATGSVSVQQTLHKDGVTIATSPAPTATVSGAFPLLVGANLSSASPSPAYGYVGDIGEVIVYNSYLTNAQADEVEGYLACKWGLQSRLPPEHPYRNVCPGAAPNAPLPSPTPAANALVDPPELVSSNGLLSVTLVAQPDANGNPELTFNGSNLAPTLRVLPGDILTVNLINNLPTPPSGAGYLNDTNLHFHGLHVSPNAPSDDSIDMLALPGQSLQYEIAIPANHPPGLYWYHSHAHGEAERQNLNGMSGALIVDGIGQYLPSLQHLPERILIARDAELPGQALPNADRAQVRAMLWAMQHAGRHLGTSGTRMTMGNAITVRGRTNAATRNPYVLIDPHYRRLDVRRFDASDGHCVGTETPVKALTLNGATQPSIAIRPGEKQFWRMVNAGSDTFLDIQVDHTQLQIVSIDGVPITSGVNTPQSFMVSNYVLPPASRVEFIVTGPPSGSAAYLRTDCFDAGAAGPAMPATILASINPNGSPTDHLRSHDRYAPKMQPFVFARRRVVKNSVYTQAIARSQTFVYSSQNTINGIAYDPSAPPQYYAQSGTVEQWTIVNDSAQVHTFHIHQIHFVVTAINGVTQTQEYVTDNVTVPAASSSGPGSVTLLMDFTDPSVIGTFLLHCHILSHEDAGMMAKIRVGTAPPLEVSTPSLSFANAASAQQSTTVSGGMQPYSITGCGGVASAAISGSTVSVSPTAPGSCLLSVSDSSGLVVNVPIYVPSPVSPISLAPNAVSFAGASAAAQTITVSGGTPPYSGTGCAGVASAAINSAETQLTITPAAIGSCSLSISDSASNASSLAISVNGSSTALAADNVTFHHDTARTGWYPNETTLTTSNVGSSSFGLVTTLTAPSGMPAFGKVYAQPLYASSELASDGNVHNLVIVATATDQIYAFDDVTGAVVWEHNFTNPSAGITQQYDTDTGCEDVNPDVGIVGTPVIDRALDRLYVVVPTKENGTYFMRLHALALGSGADAVTPVPIAASVALATGGTASVSPVSNFNRSALLEANGNIYVALGSHCDYKATATHGWLLSYSASNLQQTGNAVDFSNAEPSNSTLLGSIWMSGFGPAADAQGNVYAATGNGPYDGVNNFAMSDLRLPGDLDITKASSFTPWGEAADSQSDDDLGSGGVVLLPDLAGTYPHVLVQGGKCGAGSGNAGTQGCEKYLLNRDNMGGQTMGDSGALFQTNSYPGLWGGPATFQDASANTYVLMGGNPLTNYEVQTSPLALSALTSTNVGCFECRDQGSQPVISSNGTTPGTAVVWALKTPGNSGGPITLYAFDPFHLGNVLFSGQAGVWEPQPNAPYIAGALVSPLVANGRVYVPAQGGVAVFGLQQ
jgi:FtsP/CotA-like multicopper oxidase with cupredoxin domain